MKSLPLSLVSVSTAFTIGVLREMTLGLLDSEDISVQTTTLVAAAICTVLLYFGFRWRRVQMHLGQVLSSYLTSMATTASVVISFSIPRLIFQDQGAVDFIATLLVAVVMALIVAAALAKFYRGSTPQSPEDLH